MAFAATALAWLLFIWWAIAKNLAEWFDRLIRPDSNGRQGAESDPSPGGVQRP
jgi:hypothetical protein